MNLSLGVEGPAPLPKNCQVLLDTLNQTKALDARKAQRLLSILHITPVDLAAWARFGHPVCDSYGSALIAAGANYELQVKSWDPGDYSAIHNHGLIQWGAIKYFGHADYLVFSTDNRRLQLAQRMAISPNQVCAIFPSQIYMMGNPTDVPFMSLHLYGRNQPSNRIAGNVRIFDLFENTVQCTNDDAFFFLPEREIIRREPGYIATPMSQQLHHQLLLARLKRIQVKQDSSPELANKIQQLQTAITGLKLLPTEPKAL